MSNKHDNILASVLMVGWTLGVTAVFMGGAWLYKNVNIAPLAIVEKMGIYQILVLTIVCYLASTILKTFEYHGRALTVAFLGFSLTALTLWYFLTSNTEPDLYKWCLFFASVVIGITNALWLKAETRNAESVEGQA